MSTWKALAPWAVGATVLLVTATLLSDTAVARFEAVDDSVLRLRALEERLDALEARSFRPVDGGYEVRLERTRIRIDEAGDITIETPGRVELLGRDGLTGAPVVRVLRDPNAPVDVGYDATARAADAPPAPRRPGQPIDLGY